MPTNTVPVLAFLELGAARSSLSCQALTRFHELTSLDNVDANIIEDCVDLLHEKFRWDVMYIVDTLCILRRQCRRGRHGIAAMGSDDFLVSLEATVDILAVNRL